MSSNTDIPTGDGRRTGVAPPPQLHFDDGSRAMMSSSSDDAGGAASAAGQIDDDGDGLPISGSARDESISIEEYYEIYRWTDEIYKLIVSSTSSEKEAENASKSTTTTTSSVIIKVALQFPDNLLVDSPQVCWLLEQSISKKLIQEGEGKEGSSALQEPLIFVLGDTTVASCCPDVVAAQHLLADLLIHYGPACWSHNNASTTTTMATPVGTTTTTTTAAVSKVPIIGYTLGHQPMDIPIAVQDIQQKLQEIEEGDSNEQQQQKLLIVYEPIFHQSAKELQKQLLILGNELLPTIVSADIPSFATTATTSLEDANDDDGGRHHQQQLSAENAEGEIELLQPPQTQPLVLGGLELPTDTITSWDQLSEYIILYIASSSSSGGSSDTTTNRQHVAILLRLLSLPVQPQHIWTYTPSTAPGTPGVLSTTIPNSIQQQLKRRFYLTQKARNAQVFGILVSSHVSYSENVIRIIKVVQSKIQHSLRQNGNDDNDGASSCYTLAVGKITPTKLANFAEIDCFVLISCEQTSLLENERDYHVPIITPLELDIALGYKSWGEQIYTLQVNDIMVGQDMKGDNDEEEGDDDDEDDDDDAPYFSLVTGKYESSRKTSSKGDQPLDLQALPGQGQVLAYQSDAANFLKQREYQGLDPMLGQTEAKPAITGQRGIASDYDGI